MSGIVGTSAVYRGAESVCRANQCLGPHRKIFRFPRRANHLYKLGRLAPTRGAARDRHGRRARDAVDAAVREANAPMRTAKSCGPDAPTLASSSREANFSGATVTKSPVTGESSKETVKTIAQGRSDCLR